MRELIVDSFAGGGGASTGIEMAPHELYKAQGFPADYVRHGSKVAQVRMCGNSVSPPMAAALVRANFTDVEMRAAA